MKRLALFGTLGAALVLNVATVIGAGINHWYHNNLMYRAGIVALIRGSFSCRGVQKYP